jgi:hypothetical protein
MIAVTSPNASSETAVQSAVQATSRPSSRTRRGQDGGYRPDRGRGRPAPRQAAVDDPVDDVAGRGDGGLGDPVADGRPAAVALDEARRAHHREVLAGVGERGPDRLGELADGAVARPQRVEEREPLGIGEHLAQLRVEPVALEVGIDGRHGATIELIAYLRK